jgi:hypothetical protein
MNSGLWIIVIIPAVVAFVFGIFVAISIIADVSVRTHIPNSNFVGHTVILRVLPGNG